MAEVKDVTREVDLIFALAKEKPTALPIHLGPLLTLWTCFGVIPSTSSACRFYSSWFIPCVLWSLPILGGRVICNSIARSWDCPWWSTNDRTEVAPEAWFYVFPFVFFVFSVAAVWFLGILPRGSMRFSNARPFISVPAITNKIGCNLEVPLLVKSDSSGAVMVVTTGESTVTYTQLLDPEEGKKEFQATYKDVLARASATHVKDFGRWYVRIAVPLAFICCLVLNGIGPHIAVLGSTLSKCSAYPAAMVFAYFPLYLAGFTFASIVLGPVVFVSRLLEEYTIWVCQKVTKHFEVITSGLQPATTLDFVLRERYKLELFIEKICSSLKYSIGTMLLCGSILGVVSYYIATHPRSSNTTVEWFPMGWILVGDMVVLVALLFAMSMLNSGDNLLPALRAFRSRFPCQGEKDWRQGYAQARSEIDSIIAHVASTPLGFSLLGMPITWNVVKLVATAFVSVLSSLISSSASK